MVMYTWTSALLELGEQKQKDHWGLLATNPATSSVTDPISKEESRE